jgi:hypothetical protein
MSKPRTIRWRDKVLNDPALSQRAKIAAMALARHVDLNGRECYPGAQRCADEMGVSSKTIKRGWADLKAAGYLIIEPLPPSRRKRDGAVKVLLFPSKWGQLHQPNWGQLHFVKWGQIVPL